MTISQDERRELARAFESVPLFARCHPSDLLVVARNCEVRTVPAGTILIRAGDIGDELFVLLAGAATRTHAGTGPIRTFGPGDYFGELALLDPAPRTLDVVTTSECTVAVLTRAQFHLVLDSIPGVAPELLAGLARRLRQADMRVVDSH